MTLYSPTAVITTASAAKQPRSSVTKRRGPRDFATRSSSVATEWSGRSALDEKAPAIEISAQRNLARCSGAVDAGNCTQRRHELIGLECDDLVFGVRLP